MPENQILNFGFWKDILILLLMMILGGSVSYLNDTKMMKTERTLIDWACRVLTSIFSGILTAFGCNYFGVSGSLMYGLVGFSGYLGVTFLMLLREILHQYIKKNIK